MKIVFLGDSITAGAGASSEANRYVNLVGATLGCEVINCGIGGTRIAKQRTPSEIPCYDLDFQMRAESLDSDADIIFVFGGVNDYGHGDAELGEFDKKDPYTFFGGLRLLIETLQRKYVNSKIIFILPLGMINDGVPCGAGSIKSNAALNDYVNVMRSVLDYYAVPYIDLFHGLPVPASANGNEYFCDIVHPNDKGHEWIARSIVDFLSKKKKRADCFFGLHFDAHANESTKNVGKDIKTNELERLFCEVRPDFLQCDSKGHPGYTSFNTEYGTCAHLAGDGFKVWRSISKKYGALLYAHYSGVFDFKAVKDHPEWAVVDKNGAVSEYYVSTFGEYVDKLMIPQLKEIAGQYEFDGVWADGECWGTRADYSDRVRRLFKEATGLDAAKDTKEFIEFCRQGFRNYVKHYITEVQKEYPDFECASNWAFSSQMPEAVCLPVGFISGDLWPTNSLNSARKEARIMAGQGICWDLMAWGFSYPVHYQKSAKQLMQEAAAVISHGGGFQIYSKQDLQYGLADAWMIPDLAEVARFCRIRKPYCWRGESKNDVCIVYSTKAYYDVNGERLFGGDGEYNDDLGGVLKNLLDNGFPTDIVLSHNATMDKLKKYGLIVLSNNPSMEDEVKQNLLAYTRDGGNLVITGADSALLFSKELSLNCAETVKDCAVLQVYSNGKRVCVQKAYTVLEEKGTVIEPMLKGYSATGKLNGNPPPYIVFEQSIPAVMRFSYGKGTVTVVPFNFGGAYLHGKTYQLKSLGREICDSYSKRRAVCDNRWMELNLTTKNGVDYVHLVSLLGEHETEIVKTYDEVPISYKVGVKFRAEKRVKKIMLYPEHKELSYTENDGVISFTVPEVEIYSIVGIIYE